MPIAIANSSDNWISELTDPTISAQVSGFAATGSLTYSDLVAVLNTVVSGGTVTAAEFSDLQTIAANLNIGLATADDIASQFIQLVDGASVDSNMSNGDGGTGSEANKYWNGGSASSSMLGDLKAGTTSGALTKLIDKWFEGADMPDPTIAGSNVSYQASNLPLYGAGGAPVVGDIAQGAAGDCELCAGMIEVALNDPDAIQSMIVKEAAGVYGVRFFVDGNETWVTVNDELPNYDSGGGLVYMNELNTSNPLWADLVEKAYAELSATGLIGHSAVNSYTNINADYASDVLPDLTNCTSVNYFNYNDSNWNADEELFIQAIATGDDVVLESYGNTYGPGHIQELVSDHAFAVVGYDSATGDLIVRNPWGDENVGGAQDYDTQFEVSMSDIVHVQGDIVVGNTAQNNVEILTTLEGWQTGNDYSNPQDVVPGQPVSIAALFSVIDTAGLSIQEYLVQLVGPGTIDLNGASNLATVTQQGQGEIVVSAGDLEKLTYVPGSYSSAAPQGNAHVLVQAYDGTTWSPLTDISLTIGSQPVAVAPAINVVVAPSQKITADKLFSGIGPVTGYDVTQVSAGSFSENKFSSSALSSVTYTAPSTPGVVTVAVYDYDNSGDGSFTQNVQIVVGSSVASAIQSYDNGELSSAVAIADSAANVFANLDGLQAMLSAGVLQAVTLTDSTDPTEIITPTQETDDQGVLSIIAGQYNLSVTLNPIVWASGVSGDFAAAANWNPSNVPGPADDAEITPSGTYTVSSSEDETIDSFSTAADVTLDITSGIFTITNGTAAGANAGTITVESGATLGLGGFATNSGSIETLGGIIELSGTVTGPGTLTVGSGGTLELFGGATVTGLSIASGGILEIGAGKVLSGFAFSGGAIVEVADGGTVSNATVSSGGTLAVLSGGVADPTKILTGGTEIVSGGGTDKGAQISGGAVQLDAGLASGTTIFSGGTQIVEAGGTASGTVVSSGGTLDLLSGGSAPGTVIKSGGIEEIGSGSSISGIVVSSGITFELGSGATGSAITVGHGGTLVIAGGGSDLSAIVSSGGTAVVSSGGADSGTTILKGGTEIVSASGTVSGANISSGGALDVLSGGLADPTTIRTGGTEIISAGGTDLGAKVSGGTQLDYGLTSSATISGGAQIVESGGSASGTLLRSGSETVSAHGTDLAAHISGGTQLVYGAAGGGAISGGTQVVESGGTAGGTILSGGTEIVSAHGVALVAQISGGTQLDYGSASGAIITAGAQIVESGGVASSTKLRGGSETISAHGTDFAAQISGGTQFVYGSATSAVIVGGAQAIKAGGTASGTIVSVGSETVSAGGKDLAAQISGGTQLDYGVASGGTNNGGTLIVESGGVVSGALVVNAAASETITAHGSDFGAVISNGGSQFVYGYASGTIVSQGSYQTIEAGGKAISAVLYEALQLVSGTSAAASHTSISQFSYQYVAGGVATSAVITGDGEQLLGFAGGGAGGTGSATYTSVGYGQQYVGDIGIGFASVTTVGSNGEQFVGYGNGTGTAASTTILSGGQQQVGIGGTGTASATTVSSGGTEVVGSHGVAHATKILAGGTAIVAAGGTALDIVVSSGASVTISSGGSALLSGGIIGSGATITIAAGGTAAVSGAVTDSGTLVASGSGSLITIAAGATVTSGAVQIGNGVVALSGAANIDFLTNDGGGLLLAGTGKLDTGKTISGFGMGATPHTDQAEYIDFTSINSAGATVNYTSGNTSNTSGTLIVSSGGKTASVTLIGSYSAGNFNITAGQNNTLEITDPTAVAQGGSVQSANVALFGNYIAGTFVTAAGGQGGMVLSSTAQGEAPLLAHPHS
jgi:autotransporter passenger strand-loop-strand repeat protein